MAAYNINGKCEDCKYADVYGRNCKYGLLFPIKVVMAYGDIYRCPNFKSKSAEQMKQKEDKNEKNNSIDR